MRRLLSSQLAQNIVSNYASVVWMGLLSLGLIPVYLRLLGPEEWGVVAICMAIQGFMGLLDAGLGQIMPRDIALAHGKKSIEAKVFQLFCIVYIGLGTLGFFVGQWAVPYLVEHWFNSGRGLAQGADVSLRLVLVQFLFQFANNAHSGYWNGSQRQMQANIRLCLFGTAKHLGALALVSFWTPQAVAYLLPFAGVSALEWWFNRRSIRRSLVDTQTATFEWADFQSLARNAGVLATGVMVGMLVSQLDRLVLSRSLDAASYGSYVIVANLGLAFMQLQYPLMRAFFPRVVIASAGGGVDIRSKLLVLSVVLLCVAPCILGVVVAPWALHTWLGNPGVANAGVAPLRLILAAVAVNALYHLIYQRIVAAGENRVIVWINVLVLLVTAPTLFWIAPVLGAQAGGVAWLLASCLQLGLGGIWLLRLGQVNTKW